MKKLTTKELIEKYEKQFDDTEKIFYNDLIKKWVAVENDSPETEVFETEEDLTDEIIVSIQENIGIFETDDRD